MQWKSNVQTGTEPVTQTPQEYAAELQLKPVGLSGERPLRKLYSHRHNHVWEVLLSCPAELPLPIGLTLGAPHTLRSATLSESRRVASHLIYFSATLVMFCSDVWLLLLVFFCNSRASLSQVKFYLIFWETPYIYPWHRTVAHVHVCNTYRLYTHMCTGVSKHAHTCICACLKTSCTSNSL